MHGKKAALFFASTHNTMCLANTSRIIAVAASACLLSVYTLYFSALHFVANPQSVLSARNKPWTCDEWHKARDLFITNAIVEQRNVTHRHHIRRSAPAADNRHDSYPLISGDTYRSVCHWTFDETGHNNWSSSEVSAGHLIFVKTDMLGQFYIDKHQYIQKPYILITSNSDAPSPGEHFKMLDDPQLVAWYGQNADAVHAKFHSLPIGFPNRMWKHGNVDALMDAVLQLISHRERPILLYVNFGTQSNANRQGIKDAISRWNLPHEVVIASEASHEQYLKDLRRSRFVLSPAGNGVDCHRTWEALLMGAVPIVPSGFALSELQQTSPLLIADNFLALSPDELRSWKYPAPNGSAFLAAYWFSLFEHDSWRARQ